MGTLKIPAIGLSVKIYQGTDNTSLKKGAGHFEDTSIWDGNVALAGHNRGVNNHFGEIHVFCGAFASNTISKHRLKVEKKMQSKTEKRGCGTPSPPATRTR